MGKPLTLGLTHIALLVKDAERSLKFYQKVFDVKVMYHNPGFVQVQTPGSKDIIVFEESKKVSVGKSCGIVHFGFRLKRARDVNAMAARVKAAGGKIREKGEFVPGEPYIFLNDPDGYEVEIWYELPPKK